MQAPTRKSLYQEHDRIVVPDDVPVLGVRAGDEGIIRRLTYLNNSVFAFVRIDYSTGQTRGWIVMEVKPKVEVRTFTTASSEQALTVSSNGPPRHPAALSPLQTRPTP